MSKLILVVEDQPDNRQIIRDMLARTNYEITEAENGEEALAAIAKQRPDLILMDIQLPIIDGYTATCKGRSYFAIDPDHLTVGSVLRPVDQRIDEDMISRDEVSDEALEAAAFVALGGLPTLPNTFATLVRRSTQG
jgi:hypothetical protein